MNVVLSYILRFFGLAKEEWHYTHNTYSQHIIEYFVRVVDPHRQIKVAVDPYTLRPLITDSPIEFTATGKRKPSRRPPVPDSSNYGGVPTADGWENTDPWDGRKWKGGDTGER